MLPFILKRPWGAILALSLLFSWSSAQAQTFANLIFFGDSNTDSGRYKYVPQTVGDTSTYRKGGFTTNPGLMWSEALGARFGIPVTPSSAPGGGNNYAAGGARVLHSNSNKNQWSATQQIAAYLASVGGIADPNTLYTVNIGTNDLKTTSEAGNLGPGDYGNIVNPRDSAKIIDLGQRTAALVAQLYGAGGRYFLIPNMFASSSNTTTGSRDLYSQTVWNTIADNGINFIPADAKNLLIYIARNASTFGITNTNINTPACGAVLSANCTAADWVTPDAATTYLYADTDGHLASGTQRIESDYYYALITAPSQMSFLAEAGLKRQSALVSGIRNQMDLSFEKQGEVNTWITGDLQSLRLRNFDGFPNDPGNPASLNIGFDYKFAPGWLGGFSIGYGDTKQTFDTSGGKFTMNGPNASLYTAFRSADVWANGIVSASALSFTSDRRTALGIATFSNIGSTSGDNFSLAVEGGYDRLSDLYGGLVVKHGPVFGLITQRQRVEDFTENNIDGAPTPLSFATQIRRSAITSLGYRASLTLGPWTPFAKATWNHEFLGRKRQVMATLTSVSAPSFAMPAVQLGKNYMQAELGTRYKMDERTAGFISLSSPLAQAHTRLFGVQVGLNMQLD